LEKELGTAHDRTAELVTARDIYRTRFLEEHKRHQDEEGKWRQMQTKEMDPYLEREANLKAENRELRAQLEIQKAQNNAVKEAPQEEDGEGLLRLIFEAECHLCVVFSLVPKFCPIIVFPALLSAQKLVQAENVQFRNHISKFLNTNMRMGLLAELGQREPTKVAKILEDIRHESREGAFKVLLLPSPVPVGNQVKAFEENLGRVEETCLSRGRKRAGQVGEEVERKRKRARLLSSDGEAE
jgi:hypothetical protein